MHYSNADEPTRIISPNPAPKNRRTLYLVLAAFAIAGTILASVWITFSIIGNQQSQTQSETAIIAVDGGNQTWQDSSCNPASQSQPVSAVIAPHIGEQFSAVNAGLGGNPMTLQYSGPGDSLSLAQWGYTTAVYGEGDNKVTGCQPMFTIKFMNGKATQINYDGNRMSSVDTVCTQIASPNAHVVWYQNGEFGTPPPHVGCEVA